MHLTTRRNWESAFWKHLYPFFKDRLLSTITRVIRLFQRQLVDKGLEPGTIKDKPMKVLRMMLHQAYGDEIIIKTQALAVRILPQGNTALVLSRWRSGRLSLLVFTGMCPTTSTTLFVDFGRGWRPNEACALKWSRIDFRQGKILIREGRVLGQTGIPKSAGSLRDIDLLPPVRQALTAQKSVSWIVGNYVFWDEAQRPINQELFRMKVREPVLKRLGIRYRPPYQMRHTFATLAISAGRTSTGWPACWGTRVR